MLTAPGLAWKLPAPMESAIPVDLRLRTTSTGLQDVGTRDGLRILVQAYVAWQVPADPAHIRQFLRAVRNDPDEAARQLRSLVGSALQVTASSFDLADLVNTDPARLQLAAFEQRLRAPGRAADARTSTASQIQQVGIERLSLPDARWPPRSRACGPSARRWRPRAPRRGCAPRPRSAPTPTRDARITVARPAPRRPRSRRQRGARRPAI